MDGLMRRVLWGHRLDEYRDMFDLAESSLALSFLEYQSGPSAFQAEMRDQAAHLLSYDAWFDLDKASIRSQIQDSFEQRLDDMAQSQQSFNLSRYGSFEALVDFRRAGIEAFLADYDLGHAEGRYLPTPEKALPFDDFFFDIALSAHYFFSKSIPQSVDHHVQQIIELTRVAKELRIFPLVDAEGYPSELLGPVLLELQARRYGVELREVSYQLQPRGNAMLRIWAEACLVD